MLGVDALDHSGLSSLELNGTAKVTKRIILEGGNPQRGGNDSAELDGAKN